MNNFLITRKLSISTAFATALVLGLGSLTYYIYYSSQGKKTKSLKDQKDTQNEILKIPIIDVSLFFDRNNKERAYEEECCKVADSLHKYGIVILKDPRVSENDNNKFLDLMEQYFELSDGIRDARPEYQYQVGVTPARTELPRNQCGKIGSMTPDNKPLSICPPEKDPKWRFFWRTGPLPLKTEFPSHNMESVIPPEFPNWKETMDTWGSKTTDALFTIASMAATGFGMASTTFTSRMEYGPHLLAPTGSDFNQFGTLGTVLAGFHYDLNFLTIHGKSRFPGLFLWTREGKKTSVYIPDGCLLVQAGKQIEYLTGGYVLAGFHEVVVTDATVEVINKKKKLGESLWRVSSTCFGHIQSDQILEPLAPFNTSDALVKFPPIKAGHQVLNELKAIELAAS